MNYEQLIQQFQQKIGCPKPKMPFMDAMDVDNVTDEIILLEAMSTQYKQLYRESREQVYLRIELILEELAEVLSAISRNDQVQLLDGLVDLVYVTIGTATQFDLPFDAAFQEVHRSNMTKSSGAANHSGNKGKCESFSPANIRKIIDEHRAKVQAINTRIACDHGANMGGVTQ